jgi:hypothetical protein
MEAKRDDDEESECQQLDDKTDLHDCVTALLSRNIVRHAGYATKDLNEEGDHIAGYEDRCHEAGWDPQTSCVAVGFGCYVEDHPTLFKNVC